MAETPATFVRNISSTTMYPLSSLSPSFSASSPSVTGPRPVATLKAAFDLEQDPGEEVDCLHAGAAWPAEVFDSLRAELEASAVRVAVPEAVELDASERAELDDLGYVEEER